MYESDRNHVLINYDDIESYFFFKAIAIFKSFLYDTKHKTLTCTTIFTKHIQACNLLL
jgi:hypothetical protein